MKGLLTLDVKLGMRSYVHPVYLLVALAYGIMLAVLPEEYLSKAVPLFLILEPGMVGFAFVGTEIFAEKKDGVIGALAVTPIDWRDYIIAKTLSMMALSLVAGAIIFGLGTRSLSGLPYVLAGTLLLSAVYTLLGIAVSAKYRDLDDYFVPVLGVMVVSLLPFLHHYGYLTGGVWRVLYLIPSYPALYFFKAPFEEISTNTLLWSALTLIIWSGVAYNLARIRFYRYAVEGLR
ncbi:ABC transporter permease [Thermococcus thermotolerans]|uniref:ABC transporter permease n=1 Tax=Thermococcus thermotolerans TaxID=2969672 RepID=UPI00215816C8|nr:ABC transporter permease [Thermococcus thermotolerans]